MAHLNVSAWSIRNPIPSVLGFLLLTLIGLLGFHRMGIQNMPDIDLPMVVVSVALPGAAPSQMETEIARKIENSVASVQGVKHIYTQTTDGSATITIEFRLEKPTQEALDDVRDAVSRIRSDLPGDMRDPVISKSDLAGTPILTYTVASSRMDDEALSWFVDNQLTRALLSLPGVGAVNRVGGVSRQIRVELDPDRMQALGVTAADLSRRVRQIQQEASGGRADVGGAEQSVRTIATVQTAEQLARLELPLADGRAIRLDRIASVRDTIAEPRSLALLDGKPVVAVEIVRSKGGSEVNIMHAVRQALDEVRQQHPDIRIDEAFNFVTPVVENYDSSMQLLYEGALLAILVVWLFLRDWRATLVSAAALPLSIIPTFGVIHLLGFSINAVTLLSLSLVVGILVDDAIVEIENIMRHLRMGKRPYQAAMEAADEIGLAVIATTFTLIAVFLPTAFMTGIVGKFFVEFGWTAAISVFFSLVVARLLTPMMAAYLLKPQATMEAEPRWHRHYMALAHWCLHHKGRTAALTTLFFGGVLFGLAPRLPTGFIPPDDLSQTQIQLTLPPGSTLAQTRHSVQLAEQLAAGNPHVRTIYTTIGGGASGSDPFAGGGSSEVREATLTLNLTPREERAGLSKQAIERDLRERMSQVPGVRVKVGLGGSGEKYQLVLSGDEGETLARFAQQVEREMRAIPGVGNITSSASLVRPELVIRPDFARAADLGVTAEAIADTLRIATMGDYDQNIPKLNLAQRQVPVLVKFKDASREELSRFARMLVPGSHGPVMLANIADIRLESGPAQIDRFDRSRNITLDAELNGIALGEMEAAVSALPSLQQLPAGIHQAALGDAEAMAELFEGFSLAMSTGILCIYVVLVLLFKDFVQPVTILAALILSVPGAILALFLTHTALSMPAMIGLIMLMGVATKNAILLVEYAIVARQQRGLDRLAALLDACSKRARPIIMTTVAMGAGMLPIALGLGTDPSFRAPMAIVIIGGLITSTFLSLLVVPVVFVFIDDLRLRLLGLWGKGTPRQATDA
ncbi:efflux RND transporter permease subunit [Pseudaeromonas paramecii]|uniref:Efflux RND transporter permease subunit n=1 Tax=Pseudaeromonas paramecii TaxID=2138166 RepID=A0ABP8Q139_9GAMM